MQADNSEKFIAVGYVTWCMVKTIVVFSVLIHLGSERYNMIDGHYNNEQICQQCAQAAKANPSMEFEFSRCAKSFGVSGDSNNLHKAEKSGWSYDGYLALEDNYVILPGIFLGFGCLMWGMIFALTYYFPNGRLTILLTFIWNFFTAFLLLYCSSVIYMLYLEDFSGGMFSKLIKGEVKCYVHVVTKAFSLAVSSVIAVFVGIEIFRWCCVTPRSLTSNLLFILQMLIMIVLMVMYTVQAGFAAQKGIIAAAILAIVAWQIATEVPALAVLCKTLFDLSSVLRHYGLLPQTAGIGEIDQREDTGLLRNEHHFTGRTEWGNNGNNRSGEIGSQANRDLHV
mmetsp:Transcript_14641/g.20498  ORF Transcript_14641/g.20498 Transcript_14641/m.20498 type:complete len:339 (+) Transcript_14641:239-1255(+)|eukprot:CAMPEP_0184486050 /NCGR_PEP_ID=MMETSP0113_2-20130426/7596_1 /TAXON_ID=91329 /ORGANISM="Norrisiella sphaerica, Strain BC52" /LENGTH=338 /DNA_ID=CAMNT_0026867759 /DNA_START=240 /DNA_END=1256 /DNA_ORIENTATION=-